MNRCPWEARSGSEIKLPFQPARVVSLSLPVLSDLVPVPVGDAGGGTLGQKSEDDRWFSVRTSPRGSPESQPTPGMKTSWQESLCPVSRPHSAPRGSHACLGKSRAGRGSALQTVGLLQALSSARAAAGTDCPRQRPSLCSAGQTPTFDFT